MLIKMSKCFNYTSLLACKTIMISRHAFCIGINFLVTNGGIFVFADKVNKLQLTIIC